VNIWGVKIREDELGVDPSDPKGETKKNKQLTNSVGPGGIRAGSQRRDLRS